MVSAAYTTDIFNSHCMDKAVYKFYHVLTTCMTWDLLRLLSAEGPAVLTVIVNISFNPLLKGYFP